MAVIPQELINFVEDMRKAGASTETLSRLEQDFERKEIADVARRSLLAQADYSRQTQDLARIRQENEDYLLRLKEWKNEKEIDLRRNDAETLQYKQALQQAQAQLQVITKAQEELIRQGVIDPSQLPVATAPVQTPAPESANGNGKDYLTKKDLEALLDQRDIWNMGAVASIQDVNREHFNLFGSFPDIKKLVETCKRTQKPLEEVWANEYKVNDKRSEIEQASRKKEIDEEVKRQMIAARSEEAIKGNTFRPGDPTSPIQAILQKDKERADKAGTTGGFTGTPVFRPSHPEVASPGAEAAIQAYREGRFRPNNNSQ